MKFIIEQVALCPPDGAKAIELLKALGLTDWVTDHVTAAGEVFGKQARNEADLSFNYQAVNDEGTKPALELEVLSYTEGANWMASKERRGSVSHLGMHCTAVELLEWRKKLTELDIQVAQEVFTSSHTNPAIAGLRRYNYVIFNTRAILGVDLKFIVRYNAA